MTRPEPSDLQTHPVENFAEGSRWATKLPRRSPALLPSLAHDGPPGFLALLGKFCFLNFFQLNYMYVCVYMCVCVCVCMYFNFKYPSRSQWDEDSSFFPVIGM